jgi:hypothetical protein
MARTQPGATRTHHPNLSSAPLWFDKDTTRRELRQPRSSQHYLPQPRDEEASLTERIITLGTQSGRDVYTAVTCGTVLAAYPERIVKGRPQAGRLPEAVWINRPQPPLELASAPGPLLSSANPIPPPSGQTRTPKRSFACTAQLPAGVSITLNDNASTVGH